MERTIGRTCPSPESSPPSPTESSTTDCSDENEMNTDDDVSPITKDKVYKQQTTVNGESGYESNYKSRPSRESAEQEATEFEALTQPSTANSSDGKKNEPKDLPFPAEECGGPGKSQLVSGILSFSLKQYNLSDNDVVVVSEFHLIGGRVQSVVVVQSNDQGGDADDYDPMMAGLFKVRPFLGNYVEELDIHDHHPSFESCSEINTHGRHQMVVSENLPLPPAMLKAEVVIC